MAGAAGKTVYNARNPRMKADLFRGPGLRLILLLLILFLFVPTLLAADWHAPEQQLAGKISAVTGPGAVALQLNNRSSLSPADVEQIRNGLTSELMYAGVHLVSSDQAVATVNVTLSENLRSYLWVAEIHGGANDSQVVMVSAPRPAGAPTPLRSATPLAIQKTLLWSGPRRILDVVLVSGTTQRMIVLDDTAVTVYVLQDGRWQDGQTLLIAHDRSWPRDLRGRLMLANDHLFDAYLPGVFCRSNGSLELAMTCSPSDDPWPLSAGQFRLSAFFTATRNYFTGALSPGIGNQRSVAAFYSAAPEPRDKYVLWIFTGIDGRVHMLDGMNDQTLGNLGWGSAMAAVRSGCGSGRQILTTNNSGKAPGSIRAFEIADRDPVPASEPLELNGDVTALWTQPDGASAVVVLHNPRNGEYEAYQLQITCGQ